jgi:hypothetical protein
VSPLGEFVTGCFFKTVWLSILLLALAALLRSVF